VISMQFVNNQNTFIFDDITAHTFLVFYGTLTQHKIFNLCQSAREKYRLCIHTSVVIVSD